MDACNQHLEAATEPMHATGDGYYKAANLMIRIHAKLCEVNDLLAEARQAVNDTKGPLSTGAEEVRKAWESIQPLGLEDSSQELGPMIAGSLVKYANELEAFSAWPDRDVQMINGQLTLCALSQQTAEAHLSRMAELGRVGMYHEDSASKLGHQTKEFMRRINGGM